MAEEFIERYYQREAGDAIDRGFFEYRSGVLHLGTGAGKTSIVAKNIQRTKGRCLFVGDQDELITQPVRAIQRVGGVIAALEQAKLRAPLSARVVVASSQTLSKKARLERFRPDHFARIFIDEAHRGSDRDKRICDYFEGAQLCGMTATPFRQGLRDLSKFYDTVFYSKPMLDLCDEGWAPPMEMFHLPVEIDLANCGLERTPHGKDYKAEDIDSTITPHLRAVAQLVVKHAYRRFTIAYLPLVRTSIAFAAALREAGITARHVDGNSPDRDQILAAFARGDFQVLCNVGLVGTGVDIPLADCFLNLCPMHSMGEYQQRAGRTLRVLPGLIDGLPEKAQSPERRERIAWSDKPNALMFDLLWQHDELSSVNPACLVARDAEEAAAMTAAARRQLSPQDLLALQKRVQAEKEEQMVRALEKAAAKADLRSAIPFQQAAFLVGNKRLLDYEPVAKWELEPPSEAQIGALARWGIDTRTVQTKGAASKLMDELSFRIRNRFATLKQVKLLLQINERLAPEARVANPGRLTVAEASAIIDTDMATRRAARLVAA